MVYRNVYMTQDSYRTISFHARKELLQEIKRRTPDNESLGGTAMRDLVRYYTAITTILEDEELASLTERDKRRLAEHLSEIKGTSRGSESRLLGALGAAAGLLGITAAGTVGASGIGAAGIGLMTAFSGGLAVAALPLALPLIFRGFFGRGGKRLKDEDQRLLKKMDSLTYAQRVALLDDLEIRADLKQTDQPSTVGYQAKSKTRGQKRELL